MPSAQCGASAMTQRKPASWPIMRSTRRCAAMNIPGWQSFSTPPSRRFKQPRRMIRVLRETGVSLFYDGGNNVGMVVMYRAAQAAIAKAATHGFAIVGVTDSWMSGRSAYYVEMIAKPDLLAGLNGFKQQLSALIDRIKATPRQPGVSEIRMPGERAFRSREKGLRDGIGIDRLVYEALARLHA